MASSKNEARRGHDRDSQEPRLRVYTDGSGLNDRITAAAIGYNSSQTGILGTTDDAQVYHGEIAAIEQATRLLLNSTANLDPLRERTAVIYTNNQAAIRTLAKGDPVKDQAIVRNILIAAETLAKRRVPLLLKWIPGHTKINGNEMADQRAKHSASIVGPMENPAIRYLSAIRGLIRRHTAKEWSRRWSQGSRGNHTRQLNAEPSPTVRRLHSGRGKAHSAILT